MRTDLVRLAFALGPVRPALPTGTLSRILSVGFSRLTCRVGSVADVGLSVSGIKDRSSGDLGVNKAGTAMPALSVPGGQGLCDGRSRDGTAQNLGGGFVSMFRKPGTLLVVTAGPHSPLPAAPAHPPPPSLCTKLSEPHLSLCPLILLRLVPVSRRGTEGLSILAGDSPNSSVLGLETAVFSVSSRGVPLCVLLSSCKDTSDSALGPIHMASF